MKDERFWKGIELFNTGEFFEAHEVWEDLWHEYRETDRSFLQGLIQYAAGFYHAQCGNAKGAVSQLGKGSEKLRQYLPEHDSVRVDRLVEQAQRWLDSAPNETSSFAYPNIETN